MNVAALLKMLLESPTALGYLMGMASKLLAGALANKIPSGTNVDFWLHILYLVLSGAVVALGGFLNGTPPSIDQIQQAITVFVGMLIGHYHHAAMTAPKK